jgi:hypothetical protein
MVDLHQFERAAYTPERKWAIVEAFRHCTDPEVKKLFLESDYYDEQTNGAGAYVAKDSLKWELRSRNTCYMDADGDGQKEIFFHEKDLSRVIQLSVMLKKQGNDWVVLYKEYGVFSSLLFESRQLRGLTTVEFHQFAHPCNIFKIYTATTANGHTEIFPKMKIDVPFYYHSPIKVDNPQRVIHILADTLFYYDVALYNQTEYPYRKEMRLEFLRDKKFNSHESDWYQLVPSAVYWAGLIENRGAFSSLLIAFNTSYVTGFPEYLFLYVPNGEIEP